MKFQNKLVAISSIAALLASPMSFANDDKGGGGNPDVKEVNDGGANGEIIVDEEPVEIVDEDGGKGEEVPGTETPDGSGGEVTDDGEVIVTICDDGEGHCEDGGVPIDWVKRGGENPDVIFYNMVGGGEAPVFKGTVETGQNDKAAEIETKNGPVTPQITKEKKGPVALIKKGRVFLR
jgi:hypothetical protein